MRIIALFNLKPGTSATDYEEWVRTRDLPGMRALVSVLDFQIYRSTGLLGSDGKSPYQYIEVIDINEMQAFGRDLASEAVRKITAEFQNFADDPQFILTEAVSEVLP